MALHRNKTKSSRQQRVGKPVVLRPDAAILPALQSLLQPDVWTDSVVTTPYMPDFPLLKNLWALLKPLSLDWPGKNRQGDSLGAGSCWDWETALLLPGAPPSPASITLTLDSLSFARLNNSVYPPQGKLGPL